jgi:hypothetical protein
MPKELKKSKDMDYNNSLESSDSESSDSESSDSESSSSDSDTDIQDENIKNITFSKIDDKFSRGKYGTFSVIIMNKNTYINASNLCKSVGKQFKNWNENKAKDELLKELSKMTGLNKNELIISKKDGANFKLRGSYAHPKLITHIAIWASTKFALVVSDIVNEFLGNKALDDRDKLLKKKDDKIVLLTRSVDNLKLETGKMNGRIKSLLKINTRVENKLDVVKDKLDGAKNKRIVDTNNPRDVNHLVIVRNNINFDDYDDDEEVYDYCVFRRMNHNLKSFIKDHKEKHPNMEIILNIDGAPNAMHLWKNVLKGLKDKIIVSGTQFNLAHNYRRQQLIDDILDIYNERFNDDDL